LTNFFICHVSFVIYWVKIPYNSFFIPGALLNQLCSYPEGPDNCRGFLTGQQLPRVYEECIALLEKKPTRAEYHPKHPDYLCPRQDIEKTASH
jgi:hypothetical protein